MQITKVLNFLFSDAKIKLDSLSSDQRKIITINGWIKDELIRIVEMKNATLNKNLITKHIGSGGYFSLSLFFSFFFSPIPSVSSATPSRHCVPRECFVSRFTPALLFIIVIVIIVARFQRRSTPCTLRYFSIAAVSSLVVTPLTFDAIFLKRSSPNVAIATRR